jgi:hypothetical protein
MFWKTIAGQAWRETNALKPRSIIPSVVTTIVTYLSQWRFGVRPAFQLTLICIGIGLATYVLIIVGEFTVKLFQVFGRDQDSKQTGIEDSIQRLARLLNPDLSEKASRAIDKLEGAIHDADEIMNKPPITEDNLRNWTIRNRICATADHWPKFRLVRTI